MCPGRWVDVQGRSLVPQIPPSTRPIALTLTDLSRDPIFIYFRLSEKWCKIKLFFLLDANIRHVSTVIII